MYKSYQIKKLNQEDTIRDLLVFTDLHRREATNLKWGNINYKDKISLLTIIKTMKPYAIINILFIGHVE
ncbi:hypothetical protein COSY_0069 [Candidatus Vesicomyidisocius calyptogenae]|uniref:Uncharacterized protein n=1 Tax=Vesicomyosocius okutanii subsp. Calyptogena okutanii (strain HA) TaxID=412965 RepID=A5CXY5_VESOH|nr:hypothetical protein COSY_0069 [Candidatus Vesicomyosocius okutanii]